MSLEATATFLSVRMTRTLAATVALALLCLSASACGKADNPAVDATGGAKSGPGGGRSGRGGGGPVPVTTALVQKKAMPVTIPAYGIAEAQQTVQIRSQVTGELSSVNFTEGQDVTKGQELFVIDPRPFQAALSQTQAVLARDQATATNALAQRTRKRCAKPCRGSMCPPATRRWRLAERSSSAPTARMSLAGRSACSGRMAISPAFSPGKTPAHP